MLATAVPTYRADPAPVPEAATIDAEDILTQADEAGGFDPVG